MSSQSIKHVQRQFMMTMLKFVQWAFGFFPRWMMRSLLCFLFFIAYFFLKDLRRVGLRNFQAVYAHEKTQRELERMTKVSIKNIGYTMMDMLYFVDRPKESTRIVTISGEAHLKNALQLGRGVIGITAHLGNFPLMFFALIERGYRVNVIIRPMRDEKFGAFMHKESAKWNIKMIELYPQKEFLKKSFQALKQNELLFILLDEVAPKNTGVRVPFLGREVERATGPMMFYDRFKSPIVPMFIVKNDQGHFEIMIKEPVEVFESPDQHSAHVENISRMTKVIEEVVSAYPLQWGGWLNKKWNE